MDNATKDVVRRACFFHDYKWPHYLSSGIMFFEGKRVTIEDFKEQSKLFKT